MTTQELEKSAVWEIEDPITDKQLDFIIEEAYRLGQVYYSYLGRTACLTIERLEDV